MGRPSPQLDNSEYAVGWIAALPHERAAAKAMLDIVHAPPRHKHAKDHNSYTLGSINGPNGEHNVVIASLPSGRYGTVTAATAAKQMLSSFPSIKFGLMVGIGGGIPSDDHDIRLGDVVVSQPTGAFGGVRQYDCGKVTARGFEECGALNCPPEALLNAMGELQSNHEMMGGTSIPDILESMYATYPAMADSRRGPAYIYQGADHDRLFCSDCIHEKGAKDCGGCNPEKEIKRPERLDQDPYIHYGTIASGNKVIKDAKVRDLLAKSCLCFEMEAAGLMNQFPCLVIRGICDYCDTHKNDRWQKYAAATAAAYAKGLLQVTDASDIQNTPEARSVVMDNSELQLFLVLLRLICSQFSEIKTIVKGLARDQEQKDLFRWLSPLSPSARHSENQRVRVEGTSVWILEDPRFLDWSGEGPSSQALCCFGNPGAGKTIISSVVIDSIRGQITTDSTIGLAYLYGDYRDHKVQTTENILGAIVKQLLVFLSEIPQALLELYQREAKQEAPLSKVSAQTFLDVACEQFSKVYICIDAVDELKDQRTLLECLQGRSSMQLFITGRPHIRQTVQKYLKQRQEIPIEAHEGDIRRFIDREIGGPNDIEPDAMDEKLRLDIQSKVLASAKGIFLLPVLQVHAVLQAATMRRREEALKTLPSSLSGAFSGTVARIEQQPIAHSAKAKTIIAWVHLAERPVSVDELLCSLAIEDGDKAFNRRGIPVRSTLLSCCHGLVVIDQETHTVRLVHYSFQEYLNQQSKMFGLSKEEWHSQIARTCLTFLNFPEETADDYMGITLLSYAATKWGHHLRRSEYLPDSPLELAKKYLSTAQVFNNASLLLLYREMYTGRHKDHELHRVVTLAHIAAFFGIHSIMLHLTVTVDIDSRDIIGYTPLSWAANLGHMPIVKLLIEQGVSVDPQDLNGMTPLFLALKSKHEWIAELLIDYGAAVDVNDENRNTPLSYAVEYKCETAVRLLLDKGAPVDTKNKFGETPLLIAAHGGFERIVELLLERGAEVDSMDPYGRTPLLYAALSGFEKIVRLLLAKNAAVGSLDHKYGRTPLLWAIAKDHEAIARLLIDKGAAVDTVDATYGWTPLIWAAYHGWETIARLLIEKGAAIDSVDSKYGRTPLLLALEYRHEAVVKLLLSNGAAALMDSGGNFDLATWKGDGGLDGLMDHLGLTMDDLGHRLRRRTSRKPTYLEYFT
ncbi:ankyrin repeat protein [Aspergillus flavus]|uniref:Ankyrin repeat protein n=1 Tax=Aspergillus flavus (strain ATCC 200026 / FGSC A1120 / IAM 13836 / NRRL 3357 / JCM 12722 / SRRC 167) TaxID=332952 RepID=A0A7U2MDF3_ASPFN|nr:ankyrin repeat protein [Aspergillus flavus]